MLWTALLPTLSRSVQFLHRRRRSKQLRCLDRFAHKESREDQRMTAGHDRGRGRRGCDRGQSGPHDHARVLRWNKTWRAS